MSCYRRTHRSFHNHTHRHQQQQRGYSPRYAPRLPSYQSSIRHYNVDDHIQQVISSVFEALEDRHDNLAPRIDQDQTPLVEPPLTSYNSIVLNNYGPIDDVHVATDDHPNESTEHSGNMLDNTNNMTRQQNSQAFLLARQTLYLVPFDILNRIYRRYCDRMLMKYLKITSHYAPAKDGVDPKVESEICAICHSEYEHEENIGTLQCGHEYHVGCIKQWLLKKKDCPMCRASVLPSQE